MPFVAEETSLSANKLVAIEAWWRYIDTDCDGIISEEEANNATAHLLDCDSAAIAREWRKIECFIPLERRDPSDLPPWNFVPNFVENMIASFLVIGGRIDWGPCRVARYRRNEVASLMAKNSSISKVVWTLSEYTKFWSLFTAFVWRADYDCVSADGLQKHIEANRQYYGELGLFQAPLLPQVSTPNFSEILAYWPESSGGGFPNISLASSSAIIQSFGLSCDGTDLNIALAAHYASWSMYSISSLIPIVKLTNQCLTPDNSAEKSSVSMLILLSFGIVALSLALLLGLFYHCYYRRKFRHVRQVKQLLKAKIDAWSMFDDCLQSSTSDLEPVFAHVLGLSSELRKLCLRDLVHPEERHDFHVVLENFRKSRPTKNGGASPVPVQTTVRLMFGFQGKEASSVSKSYTQTISESESYLKVEMLLSWSQASVIIVGLTILDSLIVDHTPPRSKVSALQDLYNPQPTYNAAVDNRSFSLCDSGPDAIRDHILNGSSQVASDESNAYTFISMEAQDHAGGAMVGPHSEARSAAIGKSLYEWQEFHHIKISL